MTTDSVPPYAQILVELDTKSLDRKSFTYRIPPELADCVAIGTAVSVPFGHMHSVTGYVVGFSHYVESGIRVKAIGDVLDEEPLFDLTYLEFLDWVAMIYGTPLMQVLTAALPSSVIQKTRQEVLLKVGGGDAPFKEHLDQAAQRIVSLLADRPQGKGVGVRYLASKVGLPLKKTNQILNRLRQQEVVELVRVTQTPMAEKKVKWLRILSPTQAEGLTDRQAALVEQLARLDQAILPLSEALNELKTTRPTLEKLAQQWVVEIFEAPQHRDRNPLLYYAQHALKPFKALNEEQQQAFDRISQSPTGSQHMLYGVTGSGKTEVYLALTRAMLEEGKSVMVLVPEISLTSHIAKRFIEQFGIDQIALWHSQLSNGERVDTWRRVYRGELKIIIGARSAIFVPMTNLGLIVMDEEHDSSFKQDSPAPRYHAKSLARELAARRGARLVLGSATPDVETFYAAKQTDCIIPMTQRYGGRSLASVTLVDMKPHSGRPRKSGLVSEELQSAITDTLAHQKQAIVLLNRRGFYTLITCYHCQQTLQCPHCSVAVTYHRGQDVVRCHYCGYEKPKPEYCPTCASSRLGYGGFGTQRLAEELQTLFPEARLLRLDSDVAQRKDATRTVLEGFGQGEADILIGTQMVAKGLDIPNVTLVGVVGADTAFMLPDYKASERGFQLLTQVAGRSGRGEHAGQVIIQTCQPDHPVILRAKDQDYDGFYADELVRRRVFDFPPYSQLFRLIVSCPDETQGWHYIQTVARNLEQTLLTQAMDGEITLLGPASCVIPRIQGRHRYHLMVKNKAGEAGHRLLTRFYTQTQAPDGVHFLLDVEAQSFL